MRAIGALPTQLSVIFAKTDRLYNIYCDVSSMFVGTCRYIVHVYYMYVIMYNIIESSHAHVQRNTTLGRPVHIYMYYEKPYSSLRLCV